MESTEAPGTEGGAPRQGLGETQATKMGWEYLGQQIVL